jgi:hypothetical protein
MPNVCIGAYALKIVLVVVLVLDFEGVLALRCRNKPERQSKVLQTCWVKRLFEDEDEDDDEDDLRPQENRFLLRSVVMNVPRITADTSSR